MWPRGSKGLLWCVGALLWGSILPLGLCHAPMENMVLGPVKVAISYHVAPGPHCTVEMAWKSNASLRKTFLRLPQVWEGQNYGRHLSPPRVWVNGKTQRPSLYVGGLSISHPPRSTIKVAYHVTNSEPFDGTPHQRLVLPHCFRGSGAGLLCQFDTEFHPHGLCQKNIQWNIFFKTPPGFRYVSSGGEKARFSLQGSWTDAINLFFLAGQKEVLKRYEKKTNSTTILFFFEGHTPETTKKIIKMARGLMARQQYFFNDLNGVKHYFMHFSAHPRRHHIHGTHFTNGLSISLPTKWKAHAVGPILSHELVHYWLGQKIQRALCAPDDEWWREGFTEYYGLFFAFKENLLSLQDVREAINRRLVAYGLYLHDKSPCSKKRLPFPGQGFGYTQGFVFALSLDGWIRCSTHNHATLHDFMKALGQNINQGDCLSDDGLHRVCGQIGFHHLHKKIKSHIENNTPLTVHDLPFSLEWHGVPTAIFNLGFCGKALKTLKIIKNICPTSQAYQAGLREGDPITTGYDIMMGDPSYRAHVTVRGKKIFFTPHRLIFVPQISSSAASLQRLFAFLHQSCPKN